MSFNSYGYLSTYTFYGQSFQDLIYSLATFPYSRLIRLLEFFPPVSQNKHEAKDLVLLSFSLLYTQAVFLLFLAILQAFTFLKLA